MMTILTLRNITISHGDLPLFENSTLSVSKGDRVCIIGRNGVGKSTLLKLIHGDIKPDAGIIDKQSGLKVAMLPQILEIEGDNNDLRTVAEIVAVGLDHSAKEVWEHQSAIDAILSKLDLDGSAKFANLSGGLKRRALLARALVDDPDILLLDEPTNHLDIDAINWLEKFLLNFRKTLIFITHDRILMEHVANFIVEVENGRIISWRGHFEAYLTHRQATLEAEARADALFDKRLAAEEVWIRQGIKARRTRNEGRVRALKKMREQQKNRRVSQGAVKLTQHDVALSGKVVFEVDNISYRYSEEAIIKNFSALILRGDKIGIIGANGSGKSTLLNLLLGKIAPQSGTIKSGTQLEIAYFDQQQNQLNENKSILDNVSEGSDAVMINGERKHIISYLQDFLFPPKQARSLVRTLSGGERNRVMLAKLFTKPCNVLVMDEPTNDLDIETLELLEEQLLNFNGTLLLVSHDRAFLNNIVSSTLVMEGNGKVGEYVGGYDDWVRQRSHPVPTLKSSIEAKSAITPSKSTSKLSYHEKRELSQLPQKIETLETALQRLQLKLSDPTFYKDHADEIPALNVQCQQISNELEIAFKRWEELEGKQKL